MSIPAPPGLAGRLQLNLAASCYPMLMVVRIPFRGSLSGDALHASSGPTSRIYFSQRLRLHYVDWGNASAPPLMLLHGGRDHCRNWDWVAAALRDEYHIIAPDLRGHGDSAWSASGHYTMANYIYDLAQLIHQQELALGRHRRPFARRQYRLALRRHLSGRGATGWW